MTPSTGSGEGKVGFFCEIQRTTVDALVALGWLRADQRDDLAAIVTALDVTRPSTPKSARSVVASQSCAILAPVPKALKNISYQGVTRAFLRSRLDARPGILPIARADRRPRLPSHTEAGNRRIPNDLTRPERPDLTQPDLPPFGHRLS